MRHVERVYRQLDDQAVRDAIVMLARTGMHYSEVTRIAAGDATLTAITDKTKIAGTIRFDHKNGRVHVSSVDAQVFAAAGRLVTRGGAPAKSHNLKKLREAAEKAKVDAVRPGELRHSFVDWAQTAGERITPSRKGVPLSDVGASIGHRSVTTTDTFYNGRKSHR